MRGFGQRANRMFAGRQALAWPLLAGHFWPGSRLAAQPHPPDLVDRQRADRRRHGRSRAPRRSRRQRRTHRQRSAIRPRRQRRARSTRSGRVLAPGFIDMHSHSDMPLVTDGNAAEQDPAGRDDGSDRRVRFDCAAEGGPRRREPGPISTATSRRSRRTASPSTCCRTSASAPFASSSSASAIVRPRRPRSRRCRRSSRTR